MIPRLAPRRHRHQTSPSTGVENETPFSISSVGSVAPCLGESTMPLAAAKPAVRSKPLNTSMDPAPLSPVPTSFQHFDPEMHRRRVLMDKGSSGNAAIPPYIQQSLIKSPVPSEIYSDTSCSDCSLTPPVTGPRPLVVSAKRVGNDVRRKHSKRRKCRSRRGKAQEENNGFCLWRDSNQEAQTPRQESSDEEDTDARQGLPFLFMQQEVSPKDRTRKYWEWCYGKGQTIEPPTGKGWSAARKPPVKSCLSSTRPKRLPSPNARYRTPPTSPEELEYLTKSAGSKKSFRVQFGPPKAVEYEVDGPAGQLTPLPSHVTRERFSMEPKKITEAEEEITEETKQNNAILAEWEDNFDEPPVKSKRRRQKNRRSSSLFTPSPMLADKADEGEIITTPPRNELSQTFPSPSIVMAQNLASLRMESPATDDTESPDSSVLLPGEENGAFSEEFFTSELRIDLNGLNSLGGAMDNTPQKFGPCGTPQRKITKNSRSSELSHPDLTPPQENAGLASIHSVGGALDSESPLGFSSIHGLSVMGACERRDPLDSETALNQSSFEAANPAERINIFATLLKSPGSDQEWDPVDIFRSMCDMEYRRNDPKVLLKSINIKHDGVIACLDDLVEEAKHRANSKANLTGQNPVIAKSHLSKEWSEIENKFLTELYNTLETASARAAALTEDVEKLLSVPLESKSKQSKIALLEAEIYVIEEKIRYQQDMLEKKEAAGAPFSAVLCQASSHIGICGFRLDEYTGFTLQLSFEHAASAVESRFVFNLETGSISVSLAEGVERVSEDGYIAKFRMHFLTELVEKQYDLTQQLALLDLHEQILTLSSWLGRLDTATADLERAAQNSELHVDFPTVKMSFPNGRVLVLTYENKGLNDLFIPAQVVIEGDDNDNLKLPCKMLTSNYLQKVSELCYGEIVCC